MSNHLSSFAANAGLVIIERSEEFWSRIINAFYRANDFLPITYQITEIGQAEEAFIQCPSAELVIIRQEMFIYGQEGVPEILYELEEAFPSPKLRRPTVCMLSTDLLWINHAEHCAKNYSGSVVITSLDYLAASLSAFNKTKAHKSGSS